jgi:large subunit ribosomal protein L4
MKVKLYNQEAQEAGTLEVSDRIFGAKWNAALVKQVADAELANRRPNIAHTKDRAEISGGGKKPWKQKGTGRARQGSTRSPLWRKGGVAHGPRNEKIFAKVLNKKMKQSALFAVLSAKLRDSECIFVDAIKLAEAKTKLAAEVMNKFAQLAGKSVALVNAGDKDLFRASRNIKNVSVWPALEINALDALNKKYIIFTKDSVKVLEKKFSK